MLVSRRIGSKSFYEFRAFFSEVAFNNFWCDASYSPNALASTPLEDVPTKCYKVVAMFLHDSVASQMGYRDGVCECENHTLDTFTPSAANYVTSVIEIE